MSSPLIKAVSGGLGLVFKIHESPLIATKLVESTFNDTVLLLKYQPSNNQFGSICAEILIISPDKYSFSIGKTWACPLTVILAEPTLLISNIILTPNFFSIIESTKRVSHPSIV